MDSFIFRPLGLEGTGVCNSRTIVPDLAVGYSICREMVRADPIDMTVAVGGFGLYSTVDDLDKWCRGIKEGKLVRRETAARLFQSGVNSFYGYGWFTGTSMVNGKERRKVWHDGGVSGFNSRLNHYPDEDLTIVVLSNNNITPAGAIADRLAAITLGEDLPRVEPAQPFALPEETLKRCEGIYVTEGQSFLTEAQERKGKELFRKLNVIDFGVGTFKRVFEHAGIPRLAAIVVLKEGDQLVLFRPTGGFSFLINIIPENQSDNELVFTAKHLEERYRFRFTGDMVELTRYDIHSKETTYCRMIQN